MDIVCAGRCFFLAENADDKRHLWIVLTEPEGESPEVVAVMVRTATKFTDETLVLDVGDHPFIKHPSSVHFSTAQKISVIKLLRMSNRPDCGIQADASPDLLAKARAGLMKSPYTVERIRDYCATRFSI